MITIVAVLTLALRITLIKAGFKFIPDDPEFAFPCPNVPDSNGLWDFANFSQTTFSFQDDTVHLSGVMVITWDVEPTDRIKMQAEVFRYSRNAWHPTPLGVIFNDLCKTMFEPNNFLYEGWGQHIVEEDRQCPAKGVVYRLVPFGANIEFEGPLRVSGPHKLVLRFKAYDQNKQERKKSICAEIPGELVAN